MLLADKKKRQNLSEYIVYMYQTEMLVRNFEFDIQKIENHVVKNIPEESLNAEGKAELTEWYSVIIAQMKEEALEREGHLSFVQEEVKRLSDLSLQLQVNDENYRAIFNRARPAIRASIVESNGLINDPIQACLNGILGLLIARMNGKEILDDTLEQLDHFGNVLSYLSIKVKG
ncbi:uncharacterized protein DUF4924 [Roseivirga ehrenbergii]|uniref:DUF4924 domain-containing protein n=1 Tax=Roseivirga ehrenbergii (strain DSM 102268 / JCM 13514 / KCTC 12282 / NCIMB 14502 / KMM 6017) TaxID=279360 RepID=A0A150XQL0_ROSEK|nr:DUF4924 family protein [Roseivirga ehrenbergii]KYG81039.1 hypothetical protein MB14_14780 [Roseivirga ehrenbergii]TCL00908.1 uncharacterized protein DUF4924 [Roseivirga ehrenbergii]